MTWPLRSDSLVNPYTPAMFDAVTAAVRGWQAGARDEPPPTLPVLALSVLAATRMHTDARARSSNYYLRLAQALVPGADELVVDQIRLVLRDGAFIPVVNMWRDLHEWLGERAGAAGISTIRDHPELTRIGFPLSQALIRRSDRAALTRFFEALDIRNAGCAGHRAADRVSAIVGRPPAGPQRELPARPGR